MIFISLGTQKFLFNRLLNEVDILIEKKIIKDSVIVQTGYSNYVPRNYKVINFMSQEEFEKNIFNCDLFITHGGVGSILTGLKYNKKTIIVPRLKKYKEHIDDHQLDIAYKYKELGYCLCVDENYNLEQCIKEAKIFVTKYNFVEDKRIENYILDYLNYL